MSHFITSDTIYLNAFYAGKGVCDVLRDRDILYFCSLIKEEIESTFTTEEEWQCCHVFFDLSNEDLFEPGNGVLVRMNDSILYYGEELTEDRIGVVNLGLGFGSLRTAVKRARDRFRAYLNSLAVV